MEVLRKVLGSRRFWVSVFGMAGLLVAKLGFDLDQELMLYLAGIVFTLLSAYGLEDIATAMGNKESE